MASGHLVADGKLTLHGHVNLDHFYDARRQFVALFIAPQPAFKRVLATGHLRTVDIHYLVDLFGKHRIVKKQSFKFGNGNLDQAARLNGCIFGEIDLLAFFQRR